MRKRQARKVTSDPGRPNEEVAGVFDEIGDLLEIQGANPFRIRAYRNAARLLRGLGVQVAELLAQGKDLATLPGIGEDLAEKITDIVAHGTTPLIAKLRKDVPPALAELLHLPGLGPKRVKLLYDELDIRSPGQLARAIKAGRLSRLHGFGPKTVEQLAAGLAQAAGVPERTNLAVAEQIARPLVMWLKGASGIRSIEIAGSFRRGRETVGDLDVLVATKDGPALMERFASYGEIGELLARGTTRASARLRGGLQVDVRAVPPESWGAALVYFTGSKAHNIRLRRLAMARGLKINEYGVFRGARPIAGETEASVYRALELPWIAPELREDRGEIDAARSGRLPDLVTLGDIRGDLHLHTTATDGRNSIAEMAAAARARRYSYVAITEHSRRLGMAHGLDPARLRAQIAEIDRCSKSTHGPTILKGIEVDILRDGTLDLPDSILRQLDLVVAAVHSSFALSREAQTRRLVRALDHPVVAILAHPSGRLIGQREPYDVDMHRVIAEAKARNKFLELNAHPERLELFDTHCQAAKEAGVLVAVNSDAHGVEDLDYVRLGVQQARRGWLGKGDVLNTRRLTELRRLLQRAGGS